VEPAYCRRDSQGTTSFRVDELLVFVSNSISIPVDSILFPLIAFSGIISASAMTEMFYTNITVKAIVTLLAFWTIYLVPEKPIYKEDE
jgi:uncharacterized PurR-regulated membrane protein YhhQ (DUF165 family)